MTKTINVTARDIENGDPGNSRECPIALAARRAFRTHDISVSSKLVVNGAYRSLPENAYNFIDDFDALKSVRPFKFTVDWT